MTFCASETPQLNDPNFIYSFKNTKNENAFFINFYKCFRDMKIAEFSSNIHFNTTEMLKVLVNGRKNVKEENEKLKVENQALEKCAKDLIGKIEKIEAHFTDEENKKNVNQQSPELIQEIAKLQFDLNAAQTQLQQLMNVNHKLQSDNFICKNEISRLNEAVYAISNSADIKIKTLENELKQKSINLQMELERTKENWKAAEKGNREKFDAKIKEYNKMERKLENSEAKVDELQSKLDKMFLEHKANTSILETEIEQLQLKTDSTLKQNGKITAELENAKKQLNEMNLKRNVLNQLAKTCSIKTALFVKQKKASSEAKVMVPETKDKNEKENDKSIKTDLTKIHEECERQINNLTAELKNEKIKVETAEMKLKEFNDKNQSHIRYANVEEFRDIVEVPVRKRQRTLNNQLPQQQHSSSAPSTSVPTPMTSQQQQQPNYGYENFYYPQYYPQLSYPSHHLFQQFPPQNVYYPPQQQQLHQINNNINLGQPRPIFPGMNFCKSSTPRPPY